jgi:hypothetical protein
MGTKQANKANKTNADNAPESDIQPETAVVPETDNVDVQPKSVNLDFSDNAAVLDAYREADQKGKGRIRAELTKIAENATRSALETMNADAVVEAKRLNALKDSLKGTSATKATKEVDYVGIVAERVASLQIALTAIKTDIAAFLPEGVEVDVEDVWDYANELLILPATEVSENVRKSVTSFTTFKFGTTDRRDIAAHIAEWAQSVPSGTFASCQTIANFRSNEYGTDNPSSGAIAARLFPTDKDGNPRSCTLTGIVPVESTATSPKGARTL